MAIAILVCACGSVGSSAPPSSTPASAPTPTPAATVGLVTTEEAAMAAVVASEPRFAGIKAKDPNLIGQAAWYQATPASGVGAFVVTVEVGWGDCPAGCIDRHTWQFAVLPDGTVRLMSERGSPVPPDVLPGASPGASNASTGVLVRATAGPVCPVERIPPDPGCKPRPVPNDRIVVADTAGAEVSRAETGIDGTVQIELAAGDYVVTASPVEGYMGTPAPVSVTVTDGQLATVDLAFDTGIR